MEKNKFSLLIRLLIFSVLMTLLNIGYLNLLLIGVQLFFYAVYELIKGIRKEHVEIYAPFVLSIFWSANIVLPITGALIAEIFFKGTHSDGIIPYVLFINVIVSFVGAFLVTEIIGKLSNVARRKS